jgi:hypothetical protein
VEAVAAAARERVVEPPPEVALGPPPAMPSPPPPAPKPTVAKSVVAKSMDLETRIGAVWFNYAGVVVLVIGLALMGMWVTPLLGPLAKVALLYLSSGGLFIAGKVLERRLRGFARPLMAGGLAVAFFASFAGYFVEGMQCLPLWASLLLMFAAAGGVLERAERWRSEPTAGFAILLGHIAAYVGSAHSEAVAMVAVVFLSATAMVLLWRHDWLPLNLFSVITAFSSHFLWAARDPELATNPNRFWLNLSFLTSYYLIFVAADVVFCQRLWERGKEAFSQRQRVAGRSVGPSALALYATLVAALFQASEVYWLRIEFFFYPLAIVQLLLLLYHRRREGRDASFYATAAVTFVTLGLFSSLGGLALNMTLAAEALLLLVLARRGQFWFLRPLSQSVLAVNFFHFWFSDARDLDSWPTFVGAVLMASVYFVKARLNETWEPIPDEERFASSKWGGFWKRFYTPLTVPLAHFQALAGGLLLAYQCEKFLGDPWSVLCIAALAAVGAAVGLLLGSAPVLQGVVLLFASLAFWLVQHLLAATTGPTSWLAAQGALVLMAGTAVASLWRARGVPRRTFVRFAVAGIVAVAVAGMTAALLGTGEVASLALALPLATAGLLWLAVERWPPSTVVPEERRERRPRFAAGARSLRIFTAVVAAVLLVRTLGLAVTPLSAALWWLSGITVVYGAVLLVRRSPYLALGVTVHQLLLVAVALGGVGELASGDLLRWWLATEGALLAVVLIATCPLCERASLGLAALVNAALAGGMLGVLATFPGETFQPLALWLIPPVLLFAALEIYRQSPARCPEVFRSWGDRAGEAFFLGMMGAPAALGAVAVATVTGLILGRALPPREALWAMVGASVALAVTALVRNSAHLMAALLTLLGQMTLHRLLHGQDLVDQPFLEWATVTVIVAAAAALLTAAARLRRGSFGWGGFAALCLGQFAIAEFLLNQRPGPPSWLWILTFVGCWLAVEQLYRGFCSVARPDRGGLWRDNHGLDFLWRHTMALAVGSSVVSAGLIIALTWRQFPAPVTMIYVSLLYAVLFVALMAGLKSPPMAAAFAVCLTAVHPLFYARLGTARAVAEAPTLGLAVLLITLAAGAAGEWSFRHLDDVAKRRPAWWGAWYPYLLGFVLGGLFLHTLGEKLGGAPAFGTPMQLTLAFGTVLVAWRLGLRWLTRATMVYTLVATLSLLLAALSSDRYRVGLAVAGCLAAVLLLGMERMLGAQDPMALSRRTPRTAWWYRLVLVVLLATILLSVFYWSPALRGSWTTAGWSGIALLLMIGGFLWRDRIYRRVALGLFLLTVVRLFFVDVPGLEIFYRMLAFLALGVSMIAVSFLYSRFKEHFTRWL